jgi:hypothetical protein
VTFERKGRTVVVDTSVGISLFLHVLRPMYSFYSHTTEIYPP